MNVVKRVTKASFENEIEDKETEGYKVESKTDNQAVLVKRNLGTAVGHIIVFLLTVWWTFGFGNLVYLVFRYFAKADKIILKVGK